MLHVTGILFCRPLIETQETGEEVNQGLMPTMKLLGDLAPLSGQFHPSIRLMAHQTLSG